MGMDPDYIELGDIAEAERLGNVDRILDDWRAGELSDRGALVEIEQSLIERKDDA